MKSTYLASMVSAALLLGCAIANAQTSANQTADSSAMPPTSQSDTTKGNDLVDSSQAVPPNSQANPRSEGEDKASGNDLVSHKRGSMQQAMATRPGFDTLDTKKKGSLTAADVKGNKWLSKNFVRCDSDHDGTVNREEYASCQ
ncbi:MAG TPA: hypothetical protein VFC39_10285 [Acidobacteriaceae bacterium]|nr:hypothetical protein [Acidobacteriaceae bacterium]